MEQLKLKVEDAKTKLKLNNAQLSLAIGKNASYIADILKRGVQEPKQNELIAKIDSLLKWRGTEFKFEQPCVGLSYHEQEVERLQYENGLLDELCAERFNELSKKDFQIKHLEKGLNRACDQLARETASHAESQNKIKEKNILIYWLFALCLISLVGWFV